MHTTSSAHQIAASLILELNAWLGTRPAQPSNYNPQSHTTTDSKLNLYTQDSTYLLYSVGWHSGYDICQFIEELARQIAPDDSVIEVGCESGITGLTLAHLCHNCDQFYLTLHDYDGLGPQFARDYAKKHNLPIHWQPYGVEPERHNWVVATDVLEHSGNHLAFLKWLDILGHFKVVTYPLSGRFCPPYGIESVIDEWVDDEGVLEVIGRRHRMIVSRIRDDRRYLIYE